MPRIYLSVIARDVNMHVSQRKFHDFLSHFPALVSDVVVVSRKNEVLLVKRSRAPYKGRWALPGGFAEKGETIEKTAIRECWEESGIRVKIVKLVGVYSNPRRDPRGQLVSVVFLAKPFNSRPRGSDETKEAKFFPLAKLPKNLAADHAKIIRDAAAASRKFWPKAQHLQKL